MARGLRLHSVTFLQWHRTCLTYTSLHKTTHMDRLWTLDEVAAHLRVSKATVRRWTNAGRLACYRLGGKGERRFSQDQVRAFLARHEQGGRAGKDAAVVPNPSGEGVPHG